MKVSAPFSAILLVALSAACARGFAQHPPTLREIAARFASARKFG
jgi:hypothetical protein